MKLQKSFGLAIKELRTEIGISQEKFALLIDMDRTYYASVESGNRNISLNNIQKIADGFSISISDLSCRKIPINEGDLKCENLKTST